MARRSPRRYSNKEKQAHNHSEAPKKVHDVLRKPPEEARQKREAMQLSAAAHRLFAKVPHFGGSQKLLGKDEHAVKHGS